ncbi:exodeoxyribonuclease VII small subunit [Candidatus Nitrosacidococcus tergens]|uniref:Exodeoxyribonuclease 7 small subunit n=1 Tax=Candidatus Nitrosacidococcus tergens TaxID=553981 RepID=A0A7G1Q871_9GAMM|nr:exodeoxyribonuclease VII small subunit [Candidatus Nitrosacidococcus tergens]CAB1274936.1 Exodeoxyribonuclease 7 small subunit [Candidatus Nitrosacidococcus tergens]
MPAKENKLNFESALQELESIAPQMEQEKNCLGKSIKLYGQRIKLSRFCQEKPYNTEQKVQILQEKQGKYYIVDFPREG